MACEACIRGHRVSGCNHHDRKLLPIAKKGRPVSQCNHCRAARKSRASHVRCDCGERIAAAKEQAKNGVTHGTNLGDGISIGGVVMTAVGGNAGSAQPPCSCCHGGHCTCALKKEPQHLDAVPEFSETPHHGASSALTKPRLTSVQSETNLTTFANGHHKPTHHKHHTTHGSSPYSIPTVGHSGHTFGEHNGCTKTQSSSGSQSGAKSRRIKSEQSSPDFRTYPALQLGTTGITTLELTPRQPPSKPVMNRASTGRALGLSVDTNHQPAFTMHEFPSQEFLPSAESESFGQFSASLFPTPSAAWPPAFSTYNRTTSFEEPPRPAFDPNQPLESNLDLNQLLASMQHGPPSNSGDEREPYDIFGGGPSPPAFYRNGEISSSSSDHGVESEPYHISATPSFMDLPNLVDQPYGQNTFSAADLDNLISTTALPSNTGIDFSDAGLAMVAANVDAWANPTDLGNMGGYPPNFPQNNLSTDLSKVMSDGQTLMVQQPVYVPPPEDDGLWMAGWSNQAQ
ncbi:hypothetical protein FPQ18DRAFT_262946 [Pyronema domesticum]|nr:hypothetical protein FPQ18DRAFT_262946 [Pyronema domesticum]